MFRAAPYRFDLVITEQTMPSLTGDALARALRAIRPEIPIILCTGFSRTIDTEKAQALGLNAFLAKLWEGRELVRTVREVLGGVDQPGGMLSRTRPRRSSFSP
jgi:CheY-like chemotaxis protein